MDITRLLTMSIADLVEDFFVSDAVQAAASVSGVIGTWAGPRSAGTAYVMAHHHIGDLGDGRLGAWGFPRGGMGGVTQALASAARSFGAQILTAAPVARIERAGDAVTGVVLESGEQLSAPVVVSTAHPQIAFLRLLDRQALPADFVADICIPSVFDDSLAPKGRQVMSMFTQWVPHTWNSEPHRGELETYADRVFARMDDVAPGFTDSVLHRTVIGPYEMEHEDNLIGGNIFHGELTPAQMFHARPAAGYADLRTPVRGLYQAGSATHGGGGVTPPCATWCAGEAVTLTPLDPMALAAADLAEARQPARGWAARCIFAYLGMSPHSLER